MAYKKIKEKAYLQTEEYVCDFICDTEDDIANLPDCVAGSIAIVAQEGMPIYMRNASGEWVKVC